MSIAAAYLPLLRQLWSAGMHTSGWRDVAVDAKMQLGVEPSGAVIIVIGTITVTLRTSRQCSRGCAHQQRHCHDKFRCTHGSISSRSRSTASQDCYRLMALFIRSAQSRDLCNRPDRTALARTVFPCLQVGAAPTVLIDSLKEIEIGVRNYVKIVAFDCHAGLPSSCSAAFRSALVHTVLRSPVSALRVLTREAGRTSEGLKGKVCLFFAVTNSNFALMHRSVTLVTFDCIRRGGSFLTKIYSQTPS